MTRTEVVTVTIDKKVEVAEESTSSGGLVMAIPIILAVILVAVAVSLMIKFCYNNKNAQAVKVEVKRVAETESGYVDSQYVMDDKSNIFTRNSAAKLKQN